MTALDTWIAELNGNRISANAQPLVSSVATAVAALALINTSLTGPAGGDLGGNYPNPIVDGLQGRAVSAALPNEGDVLHFRTATWTPQASGVVGLQVFLASATYTPNPVATNAIVFCWGAGGGSGALAILIISGATLVPTTITIGAAGTAGDATGSTGGTGGTTTFGALLSCGGGVGGVGGAAGTVPVFTNQGTGGTPVTGGTINIVGTGGDPGLVINGSTAASGRGGSAPYIGKGAQGRNSNGSPTGNIGIFAAAGSAGGGGGALAIGATGRVGGAGDNGLVWIFEYA